MSGLTTIKSLPYVEGGFVSNSLGKRLFLKENAFRFFYHKPYANDWAQAKVKARAKIQKEGDVI